MSSAHICGVKIERMGTSCRRGASSAACTTRRSFESERQWEHERRLPLVLPKTARASIAEPVQPAVASGIPNKLARQLLQIERLNVDSNGSGDRRTHKPRLDISGNSAKVCIDGYAPEGSDRVQFIWLKNEEADAIVAAKEFPEGFKGTPVLSCSVTPGRTYAPCAYFTTHGLWLGRSETA